MTWTSEQPTAQGWYWVKVKRRKTPCIIFFSKQMSTLDDFTIRLYPYDRWVHAVHISHWAGPIEAPK